MTLCIGVDIGTSGVRALALTAAGETAGMASAPVAVPRLEAGRIAQAAGLWWRAVEAALGALAGQIAMGEVRAMAVDGTSGTILGVDAAGEPLGHALMYNDPSGAEIARGLSGHAPPETAALGATSPLARAIGLQSTPSLHRILHQADWIAGRFTGRFDLTDENNALKTAYDPVARRWPAWIEAAGLDMALLPDVRPAGTPFGIITPAMARQFSLSTNTQIIAGTTDGCAAFLATGAATPGDGVTSLGSTLTLKLFSATPVFAPRYGIYSHRIGDMWLAGGASNSGGAALLAHFSAERMAELSPLLDPGIPTGLDYYPLPRPGERFPVNDPGFAPRVTPRPAADARFFQGLLEGIAAIEALGYGRLKELGASPLRTLRSVGGGAANPAWTAIRRRLLGVPFLATPSLEAAAGTARLAWRGLGVAVP